MHKSFTVTIALQRCRSQPCGLKTVQLEGDSHVFVGIVTVDLLGCERQRQVDEYEQHGNKGRVCAGDRRHQLSASPYAGAGLAR